jgi:hypothetical protein
MRLALLLGAALLLAAPAHARRHARKVHRPPAARPEDDVRLKGDAAAFAKAQVTLAAPRDLAQLEGEDVRVEVQVQRYALGALAKGGPVPHAHLIVDNEPALELDADGAYELHGLRPGPHALRVVLCRPWHEVVKAPRAFALARFWLGPRLEGKAGKAAEYVAWPDPKKAVLTYVLPIGVPGKGAQALKLERAGPAAMKGPGVELEGQGEIRDSNKPRAADPTATDDPEPAPPQRAAVLDFYVSGARLARRGDKVRIVLDKRELPLSTEWKPVPLRRARAGAHRITIDLLDRRGLKVKNAVNRTDRAFVAP